MLPRCPMRAPLRMSTVLDREKAQVSIYRGGGGDTTTGSFFTLMQGMHAR